MTYMDVVNFVFIYVLVWWIVIFTILPWGSHAADVVEAGHASGAPANPRLKKKLVITSIISLFVTALIFVVIRYSGFSFHDSVKSWKLE